MTIASGGFLWTSDAELYFDLGKNLLDTGGFYMHPDLDPQTIRTPLYPLFVAALYGISGSLFFVVAIQNIIAAYVLVIVYRIGSSLISENIALIGTILFMLEARRLTNASQLMSETVFMLFFTLSIYWLIKYLKTQNSKLKALSAISAGLAIMTRPFLIPVIPLFALLILFVFWKKKFAIKHAVVYVVLVIAVITPWSARNYYHYKTFNPISTAGANAYLTAAPRFLEYYEPGEEKYAGLVTQAVQDLNYTGLPHLTPEQSFAQYGIFEFQYQDYLNTKAREIISQDYTLLARVIVQKMGVFFIESSASRSYSTLFYKLDPPSQIFYPFLYFGGRIWWAAMFLLMAFGFWKYLTTHKDKVSRGIAITIILMMLFFALISSMNKDTPRLRIPVTPFITLFAAYGMTIATKSFLCKDEAH